MGTSSVFGRTPYGGGPPLARPTRSTPLDDGQDHVIPKVLLWAMKDHRHAHLGHLGEATSERQLGVGDEAVYILGAGERHGTIGRLVGSSPDGSTYCLVGSIDRKRAKTVDEEKPSPADLFATGDHFFLCAVYDGGDGASNIADVDEFPTIEDVPADYLPPHPFIRFSDVL